GDARAVGGDDHGLITVAANTIDVAGFVRDADALAPRRAALRAESGIGANAVAALPVARLAPEKGLDTLVRAAAEAADPRLVAALAGSGPERNRLASLAADTGVRLLL